MTYEHLQKDVDDTVMSVECLLKLNSEENTAVCNLSSFVSIKMLHCSADTHTTVCNPKKMYIRCIMLSGTCSRCRADAWLNCRPNAQTHVSSHGASANQDPLQGAPKGKKNVVS